MSAPVYPPPALRALPSPPTPRAAWEGALHRALVALLVEAASTGPSANTDTDAGGLDTDDTGPVRSRP